MNRMSLAMSIGLVAGFATALSAQTVPSDYGKVDQKTIKNIMVKVTGCIADPSVLSPHPAVIQEPVLQPQRILDSSPFGPEGSAPLSLGHDLSKYREFQLGATMLAVAMQVGLKPSEATVIPARPAIHELDWQPPRVVQASSEAGSVREMVFTFYNDQLFKIVITYDHERTEGLADQDLVEAISALYGTATRPVGRVVTSPLSQGYDDTESIIARWADSQYSLNLFQSSSRTFGMVVLSKQLDAHARAAITEAIRLGKHDAPQRTVEREKNEREETRVAQEKAKVLNKSRFRP